MSSSPPSEHRLAAPGGVLSGGPCWRTVPPADSLPGTTIRGSAVRRGRLEGPRRRRRRSRARARAGAQPLAGAARGPVRAGQRRHPRRGRAARRRSRRRRGAGPAPRPREGRARGRRPRGAAGRRRRRRAGRGGRALLRPHRRGGAPGGLQGVRQGDHGGGGRADRPATRWSRPSRRGSPPSTATRR